MTAAAGVGLLLPSLLTRCNDGPFDPAAEAVLDAHDETGVLNMLYALKQLTGDFWTRVTRFRYAGMTQAELTSFNGILSDDARHATWFADAVRSGRVYDFLEFDFSAVDFSDRGSVLSVGRALGGASAAGFAGAAPMIETSEWLEGVVEMSEEVASHAVTIRALAVADEASGTEGPITPVPPWEAIESVQQYFRTRLIIRS